MSLNTMALSRFKVFEIAGRAMLSYPIKKMEQTGLATYVQKPKHQFNVQPTGSCLVLCVFFNFI